MGEGRGEGGQVSFRRLRCVCIGEGKGGGWMDK